MLFIKNVIASIVNVRDASIVREFDLYWLIRDWVSQYLFNAHHLETLLDHIFPQVIHQF